MKRLVLPLFTLLAFSALVQSQDTIVSQGIDFINLVQKQKNGWMDYKQKMTNAEYDLMKKQHNEMFDLKKQHLQKYQAGTNMDEFMKAALTDKLAMHKRHMEEWKALCDQYQKMAQDLSLQYKNETAQFEQSFTGATAAGATAIPALPGSEE